MFTPSTAPLSATPHFFSRKKSLKSKKNNLRWHGIRFCGSPPAIQLDPGAASAQVENGSVARGAIGKQR
jgi:hypothetical protein